MSDVKECLIASKLHTLKSLIDQLKLFEIISYSLVILVSEMVLPSVVILKEIDELKISDIG